MSTVKRRRNWLLPERGRLDWPTELEVKTFVRGDHGPVMRAADSRVTTPVGKALAQPTILFVELEVIEKSAANEIRGEDTKQKRSAQPKENRANNRRGNLFMRVM